jgi:hypothetical protein
MAASSAAKFVSTPTRRTRSLRCACAASGAAAAALLAPVPLMEMHLISQGRERIAG